MRLADMEAFVQQAEQEAMPADEDEEGGGTESGAAPCVCLTLPLLPQCFLQLAELHPVKQHDENQEGRATDSGSVVL